MIKYLDEIASELKLMVGFPTLECKININDGAFLRPSSLNITCIDTVLEQLQYAYDNTDDVECQKDIVEHITDEISYYGLNSVYPICVDKLYVLGRKYGLEFDNIVINKNSKVMNISVTPRIQKDTYNA